MNNYQQFSFQHGVTSEVVDLEMRCRLYSNNVLVAKSLCQHGHGLARILYLDVQKDLINGSLVEVLPEWKLPAFTLYAIISRREQQPMKIHRCLDALKQYFSQLPVAESIRKHLKQSIKSRTERLFILLLIC